MSPGKVKLSRDLLIGIFVILAVALSLFFFKYNGPDLVVYCAHDSVYADAVIKRFEEQSGLSVAVKYDTEATKSLGLTELLIRERFRPQCDVFWNNELLGTLDLSSRGMLSPYIGEGYARIPEGCKDPEGMWSGFGARMRVLIVNTNLCAVDAAALESRLESGDLSRVAIARPLYGTTLTHYCVLWQLLGGEGLKSLDASMRDRGIRVLSGNSAVKNQVAAGGCDFGFTDTDDLFSAIDAGAPVAYLPVTLPDGSTIVIPNTVAMISGCSNKANARRFIDFLLSAETELALANSAARQIPLGPVDESRLSDEVKALAGYVARGASLEGLGEIRSKCVTWLRNRE